MRAFLQGGWRERWSFLSNSPFVVAGLALASAAFAAGGGGGGGGGGSATDVTRAMGGDSGAGSGAHKMNRSDLTTCAPGTLSIVSVS